MIQIIKVPHILSHQSIIRQAGKWNYPTKKGQDFINIVNRQLKPLTIMPNRPYFVHITFVFSFPKSYTKKKKETLKGQYMEQKPDLENIVKPITDLVFRKNVDNKGKYIYDDKHIVKLDVKKVWSDNVDETEDTIIYEIHEIEKRH